MNLRRFPAAKVAAVLGVWVLLGCRGGSGDPERSDAKRAGTASGVAGTSVPTVSASTLYAWLSEGRRVVCFDSRPDSLFDARRVPTSIRVHGKAIPELTDVLPVDPGIPIVVIEEPGTPEEESLARRLIDYGFPRVALLEGGVEAWRREGYPLDGYRLVPRPGENG